MVIQYPTLPRLSLMGGTATLLVPAIAVSLGSSWMAVRAPPVEMVPLGAVKECGAMWHQFAQVLTAN